jgi:hypothetical protein
VFNGNQAVRLMSGICAFRPVGIDVDRTLGSPVWTSQLG